MERYLWYNSAMDIVLFFQSTSRKSWLQKLAGVHAFAREHNWFVQVIERYVSADEIRHALDEWHPVGCLVDRAMSNGAAPDHLFRGIPTVYLDQRRTHHSRRHPCLLHDSAAEAALAGGELLDLKCASYAYIGTGLDYHWDKDRLAEFSKAAKSKGKTVVALPLAGLKEAIASLPKPCGILGANDSCAIKAYHAAIAADFRIPDDVAIAGIDNDEMFCESVTPGITSAEPDFEGAGYRLAQMLAGEIERRRANGGKPHTGLPPIEKYGPKRLVRRGSTAAPTGANPRVRLALEYIRRHACEQNQRLDDIIAEMKCSRRLGTLIFKKETGRTILDEIHEHRFKKACELLAHTNLPIATIVVQCGYSSDSFIKRMFRERVGMTMREWRKKNSQS